VLPQKNTIQSNTNPRIGLSVHDSSSWIHNPHEYRFTYATTIEGHQPARSTLLGTSTDLRIVLSIEGHADLSNSLRPGFTNRPERLVTFVTFSAFLSLLANYLELFHVSLLPNSVRAVIYCYLTFTPTDIYCYRHLLATDIYCY